MKVKKAQVFTSIGDGLKQLNSRDQLLEKMAIIEQINQVLQHKLPEICQICHCGAVDQEQSIVVIYAASNATFYRVNNHAHLIQDALASDNFHFDQLLIKVRPASFNKKIKPKQLTLKQQQMLQKFAVAINRPDLVKEQSLSTEDDSDTQDHQWMIKL